MDALIAGRLAILATRVERLGQTRRDPESFHAEKSDIVASLRREVSTLHPAGSRRRPTTTWHSPYDV